VAADPPSTVTRPDTVEPGWGVTITLSTSASPTSTAIRAVSGFGGAAPAVTGDDDWTRIQYSPGTTSDNSNVPSGLYGATEAIELVSVTGCRGTMERVTWPRVSPPVAASTIRPRTR